MSEIQILNLLPDNLAESDIINNISNLLRNPYLKILEESCNIEFKYYYDNGTNLKENIQYFEECMGADDNSNEVTAFYIYILKKEYDVFVSFYNEYLDNKVEYDQIIEMLDDISYFDDLHFLFNTLSNKLSNRIEKEKIDSLDFLDKNLNKRVFFTGYSLEDINEIIVGNNNLISKLEKTIADLLSNEIYINAGETIEHIKDKYDFPLIRVHFARDYRIALHSHNDIISILGIKLKSGRDIDYTRYDKIIARKSEFLQEIEDFKNNKLSEDHDHFKVIERFREVKQQKSGKKI